MVQFTSRFPPSRRFAFPIRVHSRLLFACIRGFFFAFFAFFRGYSGFPLPFAGLREIFTRSLSLEKTQNRLAHGDSAS
jgi:hypothetical protein